jgi:hypothetical protein
MPSTVAGVRDSPDHIRSARLGLAAEHPVPHGAAVPTINAGHLRRCDAILPCRLLHHS